MFWRVVMWPKRREYFSPTSASAWSCAAGQHALRNLHAEHLGIFRLALPVRAANESEGAPLIRRQLAALVSVERGDELVDVGDLGKRQPRPTVRVRLFY